MIVGGLEQGWNLGRFEPRLLICALAVGAVVLAVGGGCSPEKYKAEADKDVYKIIDSKWHPSFGTKANYVIRDANTIDSPNDIKFSAISVPTPPETVSLAQAAAIATANSRTYQLEKESLYTSALDLTGTRHDYELQWFATVDGGYINDGVDDDEFSLESNIEAKRRFILPNGIDIGTSLAVDWSRYLTGSPRTSVGSLLKVSGVLPLLGSGGAKRDWETLLQAERSMLYKIRAFNRYRQNFVVDTINAYYGVLSKKDTITNAQTNYNRMLETQDRLEMEAQAGRLTRIEVDEAQQNVLRAQDDLVRAQQSYEFSLDSFKIQLGLPTDMNIILDQNELMALEDMGITKPEFTLDTAIEAALVHRLDLANTRDAIDDSARQLKLAAEGLPPQINITGDIGYDTPRPTEFQELRFHQGSYDFGFNADLPLDRKIQRNTYRRALITLDQSQRQYEGQIDRIKLDVRNAYRQLQQTAEQYQIQKLSLELARKRLESNELYMQAGRVTVRILLDSQAALVAAQNAVTAALVSHLDAKLRFYRDIGLLQVKPDGMWAQEPASPKTASQGGQPAQPKLKEAGEQQKEQDNDGTQTEQQES